MFQGALRRRVAALSVGAILVASGCLEEKDAIKVFADGSGTLRLHTKYNKDTSGMLTGEGDKDQKQASYEKAFYKELAKWEGVSAWADAKATLVEGCVVFDATGYFDDVTKLRKSEGNNSESFTWNKNADGGFTLEWKQTQQENDKSPLDDPTNEEQVKQFLQMMKGLKITRELVLPGKVTKTDAAPAPEQKDRTASLTLTDAELAKMYDLIFEYKKKIDAGETTKEKAKPELQKKLDAMVSKTIRVTCGASSVPEDELTQLKKDRDKARADYPASDTAKKIKASKDGGK